MQSNVKVSKKICNFAYQTRWRRQITAQCKYALYQELRNFLVVAKGLTARLSMRKFFTFYMNLGQIYTKQNVAEFMVSLFDLPSKSHILDPCFGGGVFVNALYNLSDYSIDAIEIDPQSFCSLEDKDRYRLNLFCSNFFAHSFTGYDGIIMNPPYVRQEEIDLMKPLGISKDYLRTICSDYHVPSKSNLYVYFVLHSISLLKNGGELVVIFPNAWKNSTLAPFLNSVFNAKGYIQKDIAVKGNPFEGSPMVDVCILKFIKGKSGETKSYILDANSLTLEEMYASNQTPYSSEFTVPLKSVCKIKRGLTMFINAPASLSEYFTPIISSPKNIFGLTTKSAICDSLLLLPKSDRLSAVVKSYLTLYKNQILKEKKPSTLYQRICTEDFWYSLPIQNPGNIIFPYIIRHQPCFILNDGKFIARDNFYILYHSINDLLLIALLNNYYIYSQLESKGKTYGNGLLKIQKYDVDALEIVNPTIIDSDVSTYLISLAKSLLETPSNEIVTDITSALDPYYRTSNIAETYFQLKSKRLS